MSRRLQCVVALTILMMVAAVFLLPALDLEPTALRSVRAARAILGAFALVATAGLSGVSGSLLVAFLPAEAAPALRRAAVLDLTCTLLC